MATHQQILTKINGITDNGNNTAAEVRSVLTDMLNFSGEGFEIATETLVITETQMYHYSFKGIKNQCCNLFLVLSDRTPRESTNSTSGAFFRIEVTQQDFMTLKSFMPEFGSDFDGSSYLSYSTPTHTSAIIRSIMIALMRLEGKFYVIIGTNAAFGEVLMTTIPLNFKKIVMPNASGIKNKAFDKDFKTMMKSNDFSGFTFNTGTIK